MYWNSSEIFYKLIKKEKLFTKSVLLKYFHYR